ncbi:MAG: hypothetical protein KKB78_07615 [Alphaproteobacteria bacterium]|nr:hypothetical protein [Alphaproteobacteria bacterium]MBU0864722.1 hypothetical protein [Alphaproteobacteria bacterium]
MDWLARCYCAQLGTGARLDVVPAIWVDEQPPYHPATGDKFDVDFINSHRLSGTVIDSQGVQIEVSFANGANHIIMRTPAATVKAAPSAARSMIPHDDWIVVQ